MLVETSSIECTKEGCCRTFEFKVFNDVVEGLNAVIIIAIEPLLNLI